jgi:DNA helicase-2/ATP-dependent DNA helicase PcrA
VPSHLVEDVGLGSPRRGSGYDTLSGEDHLPGAVFSPAVPLATAARARAGGGTGPGGPARTPGPRGSTGAEDLGLAAGDEVVHDHWGRGVVVSAKGEGSRAQATVRFDSVGKKNLLLSATPLRRV